jgi:flagellar motor switch protein FliN/FliY
VTNPENNAAQDTERREAVVGDTANSPLDALLDVLVPVVIEFGRTNMMLQDVLNLGPGSVVELDRAVGEPVDVFVSDRKLAEGEVVVMDDQFGIRITRIHADRSIVRPE